MSTPPHDDPSPELPTPDDVEAARAEVVQQQAGELQVEVIKQAAAFAKIMFVAQELQVSPRITEANAADVFREVVLQLRREHQQNEALRALLRTML